MNEANCELIKQTGSKLLHERATFFKRLAIGAADPKFAAKLQALVDEYEGEAARVQITSGGTRYAGNSLTE